jgi:hypothetical protein
LSGKPAAGERTAATLRINTPNVTIVAWVTMRCISVSLKLKSLAGISYTSTWRVTWPQGHSPVYPANDRELLAALLGKSNIPFNRDLLNSEESRDGTLNPWDEP